MKAFKTSFANVFFVLAISIILTLLSFPAWAEDVQSSEVAVEATAEQIAGTVADQAAGAVAAEPGAEVPGETAEQALPETDKKVEEGAEATSEAAAGGSAMTLMDSGGGAGAGGGISSAMIPEPSIFTGSLTTRIPIIVPPGRGGIAPNLALVYNSSKRNGWIGVGWDLDMGAIQRSTKYGLDCEGNDYVAISNGGSTELVSRTNDWGGNYYGAKIEGSFTKYKKNSTDEEGWEVTTKDGTKYFYGTVPARHSLQQCETGVFKWLLDKVQDTNGNFMDIYYYEDQQNGQIYLDRIKYTGNGNVLPSNYVQFHREERTDEILSYSSHVQAKMVKRLKSIEVGINEDEVVRVYTLAYKEEYEPSVLASVTQYGDDAVIDAQGSVTSGSSLPPVVLTSQETEDGYDAIIEPDPHAILIQNIHAQGDFNGDGRIDFLYGPVYDDGRIRNGLLDEQNICFAREDGTLHCDTFHPPVYSSRVLVAGDFNGDGKTDLLISATDKYGRISSGHTIYSMLSNGDGTFTQSTIDLDDPAEFTSNTYHKVVASGDFNRDGLTDFVLADVDTYGRINFIHTEVTDLGGFGKIYFNTAQPLYLYLSMGDGSFERSAHYVEDQCAIPPIGLLPSGCMNHYAVQSSGDFNGDGKTDLLLTMVDNYLRYVDSGPNPVMLWLANDNGGFDQTIPQLNMTTNDRVHAQGDFNGDGLPDLLVGESDQYGRFKDDFSVATDQMKVCINQGNGSFTSTDIHVGYQHLCYSGYCDDYDVYGINLKIISQGDFNGDGLTDFCIAQTNEYGEILNPSAYSFTYYAAGDGLFRAAYSPLEVAGTTSGPKVHGDFNGDGKSDFLLADIDGDTGMLNANDFYIHISKPGMPDLLTSLSNSRGDETHIAYAPSTQYEQVENPRPPFVVQTVSSITVEDGMGHEYLTQFDYGDALFDFQDRDFRGFAWAKKINPDGTTEKTGFLQGEFNKGRPSVIELRECDDDSTASLLNKTINTWQQQDTGDEAKFVYLEEKSNQLWEGGTNTIETLEQYTYSDYVTDQESAHGGIKTLITSVASGAEGETSTTTKEYENFGVSGGWVWRMTREKLSGSTSGHKRTTVYGYEMGTGNLLSKTFCLDLENETGPTLTYDYDDYGNLTSERDAENNLTETIYDQATQTYPVEIHYPLTGEEPNMVDHIVHKQYDYRLGAIAIETDENLNQIEYDYDEFGRLSSVSTYTPLPEHQLAAQTTYVYSFYVDAADPNYTQTSVKETNTSTINGREYFDGLGRSLSTVSLGDGQTVRTLNAFNNMGRIWQVAGPFFNAGTSFNYVSTPPGNIPITETVYDKRGRPLEISSNDTVYEWNTTSFDYIGLSTTITDPDQKQKTERKDYLGRLIQVVEYNNTEQYTTSYTYNVAGDLLSVTDHLGGTPITMAYDNLGRKTAMTDPDMGSWAYAYDDNGNLISQTDAKNQTITFNYDTLNRVLTKTYSTSDPTVTYTYDNLSIPNGSGKLASVTNTNVTTVYNEYDAVGRARQITKTISGDSARATRYDYDYSGKLTHIGYPGTTGQPDGFQVNYTYYAGTGLIEAVTGSDLVEYARFMSYTASGKISRLETQHGTIPHTVTTYTYDDESTRLTEIVTTDKINNDVQRKSYTYSQAGDIEGITDSVNPASYTYDYDGLHRLTEERINGNISATYVYDAIGNITSKTEGAVTLTYQYNPSRKHAVSGINGNAFGYDNNGNMISGYDLSGPTPVARTIAYNADNMPINVTRGSDTTSFTYDGQANRVKKTLSGGSTTYYVGEHFEVVNGNAVIYIFAGDMRIAKKWLNNNFFYHKDHLGSSTVITVNGSQAETDEYLPYGKIRTHSGGEFAVYKFTDQELDATTGLYDYGARMYDPVIGRFITADSIVPDPSNPQSLNRYSYCLNNPLIYIDPTGHFSLDKMFKSVVTGIVGGAVFVLTGGTAAPIVAGFWAGVASGATAGALSGGGIEAVVMGAVTGGILGGIGGFAYNTWGAVGGYAILAGSAGYSVYTEGLDGLAYMAGGLAGGIVGYSGANWMQSKFSLSPAGTTEMQANTTNQQKITRSLTVQEKEALSPYIPKKDLEQCSSSYWRSAKIYPKWADGITRGNDIYFRIGKYTFSPEGLALLGHELIHVGQYRQGMTWFTYLLSCSKGYNNSKYEILAYKMQDRILTDLYK